MMEYSRSTKIRTGVIGIIGGLCGGALATLLLLPHVTGSGTALIAPQQTVNDERWSTHGSVVSDQERIVAAVRRVAPSVVALDVTVNGVQVVPADPFASLFGGEGGTLLRRFHENASGSGFVYRNDGSIVTNAHVVANASRIQVIFADGTRRDGRLVAIDPDTDLAVVRVDRVAGLPPALQFADGKQVQQGQWAIAIGEPLELQQTVTVGVVSAFNRDEQIGGQMNGEVRRFTGLLQTSAPINPGNSGGPLIDIDGRVIGVNQATASPQFAQGIGFAIPIERVKRVLAQLQEHPNAGRVASQGFMGVEFTDLTPEIRQQLSYFGMGAVVAGVIPGSPAETAQIQPGDVVQQIAGTSIRSAANAVDVVRRAHPGDRLACVLWSQGERHVVTVQLGERPINE